MSDHQQKKFSYQTKSLPSLLAVVDAFEDGDIRRIAKGLSRFREAETMLALV